MASEAPPKLLKDLRVSDLKYELEKRELATSGVKTVLLGRLQKQMEDDGFDPETYDFNTGTTVKPAVCSSAEVESVQELKDVDVLEDCERNQEQQKETKVEESKIDTEDQTQMNNNEAKEKVIDDEVRDPNLNLDFGGDNTAIGDSIVNKVEESQVNASEETNKIRKSDKVEESTGAISSEVDSMPVEEDSINLMIEDEENLFDDDVKMTLVSSSPPRPETAPVVAGGFTSRDIISMGASRSQNAPSDNSSMRVQVDESESVDTQASGESKTVARPNGDEKKAGDNDGKSSIKLDTPKTGKHLWISNLSSSTRATDLKSTFSKYGKVMGAKVMTNARTPGARCYGLVNMSTAEDAARCIKELHKTELHGRTILVDLARSDSSGPQRSKRDDATNSDGDASAPSLPSSSFKSEGKNEEVKKEEHKNPVDSGKVPTTKDEGSSSKVTETTKDGCDVTAKTSTNTTTSSRISEDDETSRRRGSNRGREDSRRSVERRYHDKERSDRGGRPPPGDLRGRIMARSPGRRRRISPPRRERIVSPVRSDKPMPGILTFEQIRKEQKHSEEERRRRDRQKLEDRRRREEDDRRRLEEEKLHRERELLRREREKLERDKQELIKFERERQRLERERLMREKEELDKLRRQQQLRLDEVKRAVKRHVDDRDPYYDDRKRIPDPRSCGNMSGGNNTGRYDGGRGGGYNRSGGYSNNPVSKPDEREVRSSSAYGGRPDRDHRSGGERGGGSSGGGRSGYWSSGGGGSSGMMSSGDAGMGSGGGSSAWARAAGSGNSNPNRPPMVGSGGLGVTPYMGGSQSMGMGSGSSSGYQGGQSVYSGSDRFDAYKNPLLSNKRY